MTELELELLAFLGTDFGASVALEIGEEAVGLIFASGARAQLSILAQDLELSLLEEIEEEKVNNVSKKFDVK